MQGRDPFSGDCDASPRRSWAWRISPGLQGRDPFSGDCDSVVVPAPRGRPGPDLQGRDPFSGDCDRFESGPGLSPGNPRGLARTRPVFRGLRRRLLEGLVGREDLDLQGRDPFSGDCDVGHPVHQLGRETGDLQGRDPFSGDCDDAAYANDHSALGILARTRPVFRGLRHSPLRPASARGAMGLQGRDPFSGDCDAELGAREQASESLNLQGRDPFSGDCDASSRDVKM